jgi:hypothetical protein
LSAGRDCKAFARRHGDERRPYKTSESTRPLGVRVETFVPQVAKRKTRRRDYARAGLRRFLGNDCPRGVYFFITPCTALPMSLDMSFWAWAIKSSTVFLCSGLSFDIASVWSDEIAS